MQTHTSKKSTTTPVQRKSENASPLEVLQRVQPLEEEELLQGKFKPVQRQPLEEEELLQGKFQPIQRKANKTGLPDSLKSGVENLSGYSMDDVKVHYNSDQPAQLNAHAYAQGTDIHIAPGQEQHLPHEAWHVVQQKQGRVRPTMQLKGKVNVNDDVGLEREADVMGARALQTVPTVDNQHQLQAKQVSTRGTAQLARKKPPIRRIIALSLESAGHMLLGALTVAAGAGAIGSLALAPVGVVAILGGVGQIVVGISKAIRASVMGYSRSHGGLSEGQLKFLSVLTGIEGVITIATAVTGAATAAAVIKIIMGGISAFGSLIKAIRGFASIWEPFRAKVAKWLAPIEAIIGGFTTVAGAFESVGTAIVGAIGYIVNLVKSIRSGADIGAGPDPDIMERGEVDPGYEADDEEELTERTPLIGGGQGGGGYGTFN